MNDRQQTIKLAERAIMWYINTGLSDDEIPVYKQSNRNPKYSNEIWAKLMLDAISAFNAGFDSGIEPENNRVANHLYENAIDIVGSDAFEIIATLVAASSSFLKDAMICPQCGGYGGPSTIQGISPTDPSHYDVCETCGGEGFIEEEQEEELSSELLEELEEEPLLSIDELINMSI